jgi:signal transduction histidine kinase/CheY-like chemotaxis protein
MMSCRDVVIGDHAYDARNRVCLRRNLVCKLVAVLVVVAWLTGHRTEAFAALENTSIGKPVEHIVYGGDERFPPYEYVDERGHPAGLNVALIRTIGIAKGFSVDVRLMSWAKVREGLASGRIDVAAMYRSPFRVQEVDFCIPHELVYHEMFVRTGGPMLRGLTDLVGRRVLVEVGTYSAEALKELGFGKQLVLVPNEPAALLGLAAGSGDVALVTQTVGRPFRDRLSLNRKIVPMGPPVLLSEYAFVTGKGRPNLVEQINEGITVLRANGQFDSLHDTWLVSDRSGKFLRVSAWFLAFTSLGILVVTVWNRALRRRVSAQTKALQVEFNEKVEAQKALLAAEVSLRNAQRMEALGRFAGGIAHDFNNILTVILNYGNFLRERLVSMNAATDDIDEILSTSDRAVRLTRQLLAFSRATPTETTDVDFCALLRDFRPMLGRLVGEHVQLDISYPDRPLIVLAEPTQLDQLLLNFAANARDAMPNGGRLHFDLSSVSLGESNPWKLSARQYVKLEITDEGIGMDDALMSRIFEPFFTTKEVGKGTGLGLATVFANVTKLHGAIEVQSKLGQGSTFIVLLPEVPASKLETKSVVASESLPVVASSECLLLVEDDDALRKIARIALERAGYTVLDAPDGEAAELIAKDNERLSLLVTDVVMPKKSGPRLAESLRRSKPQLRVLYTSGYVDDATPLDLRKPDTAYLPKPYTEATLIKAVRKLIAGSTGT